MGRVVHQSGYVLPEVNYCCRHFDRFIPLLAKITKRRAAVRLGDIMGWAGVDVPEHVAAPIPILIKAVSKNMHSNGYHHPWHTMTVMMMAGLLGTHAELSQDEMSRLMIYALVHDLDHRGKFSPHQHYAEEDRSAKIANNRLFGQLSGLGQAQMALHEALHATAFGSDEACPDDDVVKILVDADIFASVIFPYQAALALTKGLKLEQRHQAPSAEILDKFLLVVAAKGFQHEATKELVSTLTRRDIVARQYEQAGAALGFHHAEDV